MSDAHQNLVNQFHAVVDLIMHRSMQNFMLFARNQGISMSQMGAMRRIQHRGNCNISEISEEIGISNAASSQMLDRLVQMGLVSRTEDPQDRRNKHLELTETGQQLLRQGFLSRQVWMERLVAELTPTEEEILSQALSILSEKITRMETERP